MADYKTIHGTTIKSYTTDPDNPIEGQVWYDKTNKVLQFEAPNITSAGAWRTGGNLSNQRTNGAAAGASKDSSLMFGGGNASGSVDFVESYNGGTWTEVADLNQHRQNIAGAGVQTSALAFGGLSNPPVVMRALTESWNGSGWTEVGDINSARSRV